LGCKKELFLCIVITNKDDEFIAAMARVLILNGFQDAISAEALGIFMALEFTLSLNTRKSIVEYNSQSNDFSVLREDIDQFGKHSCPGYGPVLVDLVFFLKKKVISLYSYAFVVHFFFFLYQWSITILHH
jgi:hypothetical protein